jgi:hypothetical protein
MKAGVIANLFSVRALLDAGIEPGGDVMLQSVIEEEAGGGGGTLMFRIRLLSKAGNLRCHRRFGQPLFILFRIPFHLFWPQRQQLSQFR